MTGAEAMRVFLTVDTEIWPFASGWPVRPLLPEKRDFCAEVRGYIYGDTTAGSFGIPYQLELLSRYGLKASYFVEPLFSERAGSSKLREIVDLIQEGRQEVQLHLHTEWIGELANPRLPARFRQHVREFEPDEQFAILREALALLRGAGAREVVAFRAGNFGANRATLAALARNGIAFDTSHNACFLDSACAIRTAQPLYQHAELDGVVEVPVTCFEDYPGHLRHAQICACSFQELRSALLAARAEGWHAFVIVLHSFELVRNVRDPERRVPDRVVIGRFERLCRFLAEQREHFVTSHFTDLDPTRLPVASGGGPLRSRVYRTAWRYVEQLASRMIKV